MQDKSLIIIFHEIYGVNAHIKIESLYYQARGFDVLCPNFLEPVTGFEYHREDEAYSYFFDQVGFDAVKEKTATMIEAARRDYKKVFLLGFSVGATAAWLCGTLDQKVDGVICYYGSRIRDYQEVIPQCPVLLLWASNEKSFSVRKLSNVLEKNPRIHSCILKGKHGFADPFNKNYKEESAQKAREMMDQFLEELN
jgi:dienelactone hydrolase